MFSVGFDSEINSRLEALGARTDRSKAELIRRRLIEALDDDLADLQLATARLGNPARRWTQEELEQDVDLEG